MSPPLQIGLLTDPFATLIRDVTPTTPSGYAYKTVVGDDLTVSARLVRDGHGLLAGQVRTRRVDSAASPTEQQWIEHPLLLDPSGAGSATVAFSAPGNYEFQIRAWGDRFATWRRDLELRAAAGDDLAVEFEVGARLLERMLDRLDSDVRPRIHDTIEQLRSAACTDRVRLRSALDEAVAASLDALVDPDDVSVSDSFPLRVDRELAVRGAWYELFPRSEGGFAAGSPLWDRLEDVAAAGFDVLYLPPIHPIGESHRKGRDNTLSAGPHDVGSPWAIGSDLGGHTAVHPDLGTITDVERFIAGAADLGVEVALDYALQCSPDHPWVREHPEWFSHRPDGTIRYAENPPKKYQDIYPLDFWPEADGDRVALWEACRDIFEFWIERGVSVFRVDNPHTKPLAFWAWVIRQVQDVHPEVVFLSEAFTDPPMMHSLAEVGFSQSYTYFTWRTSKWELTSYGEELARAPEAGWFRPNLWPNTPDILAPPLRDGSAAVFRARAILAATMAPSWGVYSGFELSENHPVPDKEEYRDSEKYEIKHRDHDAPGTLWPLLADLNQIRSEHPSTWRMSTLHFHPVDHDDLIAYSHHRRVDGSDDCIVVIVNLDPDEVAEATVYLDLDAIGLAGSTGFAVHDELTGESWQWGGAGNYVRLGPERVAHVLHVRGASTTD